jgi:hypothetical protein
MFFRRRNHQEETQEEKGSQEPEPGILDGPYDVDAQPPWQKGAFNLFILELAYLGIPLLLLRLINKLLTRSS